MKALYISSVLIAILVAACSILGVTCQEHFYPSVELLSSFVPNDITNLVVGLPFLLISLGLAVRGRLTGLISWPGAVFYFIYIYLPYLICVPFNYLFLPYLIIFSLGIYTLISMIVRIHSLDVADQFRGKVPTKVSGAILMGLAMIIVVRQVVIIIGAHIKHTPVGMQEIALWITDFSIGAPAMVLGGLLIWKKRALGYLLTPGLFIVYGILSLGLVPYLIVQSNFGVTDIALADVVVLILMAILCFIPFAFFVRASIKTQDSEKTGSES